MAVSWGIAWQLKIKFITDFMNLRGIGHESETRIAQVSRKIW